MATCQRCKEENPQRARFCLACGAALTSAVPQARKTVTVLFVDLVGSTDLGERLDPESLTRVMAEYFRCARSALEYHGGTHPGSPWPTRCGWSPPPARSMSPGCRAAPGSSRTSSRWR